MSAPDRTVVYFEQDGTRHVVDVVATDLLETVRGIRAAGGNVVSVSVRPADRQPPTERAVER